MAQFGASAEDAARDAAAALAKLSLSGRTFLAEFEYIQGDALVELLENCGWTRVSVAEAVSAGFVDVMVTDGKFSYDKTLLKLSCSLKNRIEASILSNKIELHKMLAQCHTSWIAETHVLDSRAHVTIAPGELWIWRPEGGYGGRGIKVVESQSQLDALCSELVAPAGSARRPPRRDAPTRALLSRYIEDMLLVNGRKFHLRMHFLVRITERTLRTYVLRKGVLGLAERPFEQGAYDDMGVHDTRLKNGDLAFPDDLPSTVDPDKVFEQVCSCLRLVSEKAAPHLSKYPESDFAYELFGCDFMIRQDGTVVLIEVNFKPGLVRASPEALSTASRAVLEGIFSTIIAPTFHLNLPPELQDIHVLLLEQPIS
eukprot:m.304857 g.304857  ORF g.304857 m.304857 type:complete len:370 (-) comp17333_c0_seq1:396-1505(-)